LAGDYNAMLVRLGALEDEKQTANNTVELAATND
jgi:hypothetical protein